MRFLKADQLFDGKKFLDQDAVLVIDSEGKTIDLIHESEVEPNRVEKQEGIICPGFINTHCHLELSHLRGKIPEHTGLPGFAKHIMTLRRNDRIEEVIEYAKDADKNMFQNGIAVVGDICNTTTTFKTKADSKLYYHSFIELIGLNPKAHNTIFHNGRNVLQELKAYGLFGSLTPHAPYSVSPELITKIAHAAESELLPISIHNQESKEEVHFLEGKASAFDDLYSFLKIDLSWYKAPGTSGVNFLAPLLSKARTILVHNTLSKADDLSLSVSKEIFWCFCPNANLYIEDRLPEFNLFEGFQNRVCFGTDSLASNHQLDVLTEANVILKHSSVFSPEQILNALTAQGAEALNLSQNFGSFIKGKNAGLNLIAFKQNQFTFKKRII